MTLNHSNMIKLPWQEATPERTLDIFDLPQYYVDVYGVRNVQFQSNHVAQDNDNPDLSYIRELRAKLDAAGTKAHQINIEIGTMAQMGPDGKAAALVGRCARGLARARKKMGGSVARPGRDAADAQPGSAHRRQQGRRHVALEGSPGLRDTERHQDFRRDARRGVPDQGGGRGQAAAPAAAPDMPEPERLRYVWGILWECTLGSGGYTNLDFGGETRFHNQQQLHDAIKGLLPRNAGGMHTRVSPTWDLGTAIKYAESLGYKGMYTIEVSEDPAVRIIYNAILANLA